MTLDIFTENSTRLTSQNLNSFRSLYSSPVARYSILAPRLQWLWPFRSLCGKRAWTTLVFALTFWYTGLGTADNTSFTKWLCTGAWLHYTDGTFLILSADADSHFPLQKPINIMGQFLHWCGILLPWIHPYYHLPLIQTDGNRTKAAKRLGMDVANLRRLIRNLGIHWFTLWFFWIWWYYYNDGVLE